ncbi:MAG TPA: response regulator, partial [Leptospiraceae bacterium]|nr:response regulator [Leptospiraceae bacterium]
NEINIMTICDYLEDRGYQITVARNGREAIDLAQETLPDLILMDIQMPEMDGKTASLLIRSNERLKKIPILVLTATAMKEMVDDILTFADGYLCKPISRVELIRELARFLPNTKKEETEIHIKVNSDTFLEDIKKILLEKNYNPDFISKLKNWFLETETARKSIQTNKLTIYIQELKEIGEANHIIPLVGFSLELLQLIKNFSIPQVAIKLQILEQLHFIILSLSEDH